MIRIVSTNRSAGNYRNNKNPKNSKQNKKQIKRHKQLQNSHFSHNHRLVSPLIRELGAKPTSISTSMTRISFSKPQIFLLINLLKQPFSLFVQVAGPYPVAISHGYNMSLNSSSNLPLIQFLLHNHQDGSLKISTFLTQHELVKHVPVNWFYRIMGVFLSSCWLFIRNSAFWVLRLATSLFPFRLGSEDGFINCMFLQNRVDGVSEFSKMFGFDEFVGREEKETGFTVCFCKDVLFERERIADPIDENELSINSVDGDRILTDNNFSSEKELLNSSHGDNQISSEENILPKKESLNTTDSNKRIGGRILAAKKFTSFEPKEPEGIDFEKDSSFKNQIMDSEVPCYNFRFQFQTDKDLRQRLEESEVDLSRWVSDTSSSDVHSGEKEKPINSYEFLSEKDFRDFIAESSVASSSTHDFFSEKEMSDTSFEEEFLSEKDFLQIDLEKETDNFFLDKDQFKNSYSNKDETIFQSEKGFRVSESYTETRGELSEKETEAPMNSLLVSKTERTDSTESSQKVEETPVMNCDAIDGEDSNSLEILWEHQDLIEQLRSELRKVRAVGLPTILEESECPKIVDDLKPWKIDEKFLKEDTMDELQKFYKSYRERMRKFDIWNYQKMYATGFLKMKDPLRTHTSQKASFPAIFRQNLRLHKSPKFDADPSAKFIWELQSDLETVYVGQTCLSWEILHWQYGKAKELAESDPYGAGRFDEVAGELQQFHVLLYRFLENEPFESLSRVESYVGNRCVLRNLLQIPLVREEKRAERRRGNDGITIAMLVGILEESMRVFWNFVKADRDETSGVFKGILGTQTELQDPTFSELLTDTQMSLQKKEKKLRDLVRSESCLVKKFQKQQACGADQLAIFFSQVDMKLVSRVMRMSRITGDQLMWCHRKLNKITFKGRRLHREPSFLLFPC